MAKTSVIERNKKRKRLAEKYDTKRQKLLAVAHSKAVTPSDRFSAYQELAELPRNSSVTRVCNRCLLTGRARGYYRKFKLSRIALRELASSGQLTGVKKASW